MDERSIEQQNLVERYVTGRLSVEETSRFEEYFLEHPECAAEVQAAQRLLRGLETVAAREVAAREVVAREVAQTSVALGLWHRFVRGRGALIVPLLAVALVPLTFQMWRIHDLEESLVAAREPQVNTPIVELSSFRNPNLGLPPFHLLTLSPDSEWIVLALVLSEPEASSYRVEIRGASEGLIWKASDLLADPLDRLSMTLPATLLPMGDYEIRVVGATGVEARFSLRVAIDA